MALRRFFALNDRNENDCNLTELNAADAVDKGFVTHSDWIAHTNRYSYVWKHLTTGSCKEAVTLLDVGSGKLQLPYFLWRNRCPSRLQYWGIELRAKPAWLPAEDAHWQVPLNLIQADILEDDLSHCDGWPGQFDVVVSFETFEHVPRARGVEFIQKLFNWTKPGGTCFFSTPNAGVSDSTADNHMDPATGESREWEYETKIELVEEAGFVVEDTYGTFCGVTHLPEEVRDRFKTDPLLAKAKKFLSHAMFTTVVSCAYPANSNNSLFHLTRPA